MPRPPKTTQAKVFEAIEELVAEGTPVTAQSLRAKLKVGSLTTLTKDIRAWQAQKADAHGVELPEQLRAAIETSMENLIGQANGVFAELSTRHEAALVGLSSRHEQELSTLRRSTAQKLAHLQRLLESKDEAMEELERRLLTLETENRVLREKRR